MKTNHIYTERLLKLAKHIESIKNHPEHGLLETVKLVDLISKKKMTQYEVRFQQWIFEELPIIFDDWYFNDTKGCPIWEGANESGDTVSSVVDFFGLTLPEFIHLFDIDGFQQTELLGGKPLSVESNGYDVANNIYELIERRRIIFGLGDFPRFSSN